MNEKRVFIGLVLFLGLSFYGGACEENLALVAAGYNAKVICSSVFISGRDQADIEKNDLLYTKAIPVKTRVDREKKEVIATVGGINKQRAVYRDGLGCTLAAGVTDEQLVAQAVAAPAPITPLPSGVIWPHGEKVDLDNLPAGIDKAGLERALDFAFTDPSPRKKAGTRAVVVIYQGQLVAERYAPGFSADMPLIGWSMTKSVTNALAGILVRDGKLDVQARAPVPEWSDPADPRSAITLEDLLRMSSGLKWEDVSLDTEILRMMFLEPDTGAFAASMPLAFTPGTHWAYSTGTTNIISRIVRQAVGGTDADYFAFPRRELFGKIGMFSAVIEPDASGTFVGSSYMYATARDWARFGLLFLNDGVWNGERILPEGWVKYSVTPAPAAPKGGYGAQWWLNAGTPGNQADRPMPELPPNLYYASGMDGQTVAVFPSSGLVVVRLGYNPGAGKSWDLQRFLKMVMESVNQ